MKGTTRLEILRIIEAVLDCHSGYDLLGHSQRVGRYTEQIGQILGLQMSGENLYLAGLLHDIGKLKVSRTILDKPGRLEGREVEEIYAHPAWGAETLQKAGADQLFIYAALYHHERLDGTGYPYGMHNNQIPIISRIVAVADVFDAMTSQRSYRPALPVAQVFKELRGAGYDQSVVDALKVCLQEEAKNLSKTARELNDILLGFKAN